MKIVCIEEHVIDPAIASATREAQAREAPWLAGLGSRVKDEPPPDADRPSLLNGAAMMPLALDLGAGRLAAMDRHRIDVQVLSYSNAPQLAPADAAASLCRAANDRLAAAVRAHPSRFEGFATLPWQDAEAAVSELRRTVEELGFRGALLVGRPGAGFLDDNRYEPVLAALETLRVPLYVHPGPPAPAVREIYYGGFDGEVGARLSLFGWGWHNEAGIHVVRLILSGTLDRHPGLRLISGHWGEMVPFYLQRLDDSLSRAVTGLSRTITDIYRDQVFVTPSGMLNRPHFDFTRAVLGSDRILYAVDYPYLTLDGARRFLETLPIGDEEKERIAFRNWGALLAG